jgi:hypothetical protein
MTKERKCTCKPNFPETICVVCVADLLHYAPKTVFKKAEAGEIPSVPISRRHRIFYRESIMYWLKNLETSLVA